MDDSEARENIAEMIEAGEFDSSDSENDFYDDEADDEGDEDEWQVVWMARPAPVARNLPSTH